jgi:tetratricopeptide (TPR) repeat protein
VRTATVLALLILLSFSTAARADYEQSMAQGGKRSHARDYAGAAAAYKAALAERPNDARALNELSFAAYMAGDHAGARQAATDAIAATTEAKLQAAAYFNRGLAAEALHDPGAARADYERSIDLRENAEVRKRIDKLDAGEVFVRTLAGPFAEPKAFCHGNGECVLDYVGGDDWNGGADPFLEVKPILTGAKDEMEEDLNLAVRLADGWWVLPHVAPMVRGHAGSNRLEELGMRGKRLYIRWYDEIGRFGYESRTLVLVCGVGPSKQPSCAGPIEVARTTLEDHCGKDADCKQKDDLTVALHCAAELRGDVLEVKDDKSKLDLDGMDVVLHRPRTGACAALKAFGKHPLVFK